MGWPDGAPVTARLRAEDKETAMKHLETKGPSQREQQVVGLRSRKAWLHHREMGRVVGEIREGARVR